MKTLPLLLVLLLVLATAAHAGITGKQGQTAPSTPNTPTATISGVRADVEYSTTGALDTPATMGGDVDGWGSDFITRWHNDTGADVAIVEFGWPCGGFWARFWYVWITDTLPADPYTLELYGTFVAASEDDTEWPPSQYTYVDVSGEGIVIPEGATMYFGYGNPGMGGQIAFNGVETYSYLDDGWDLDGDFGRTAVLQFKGDLASVPVEARTLSRVKALFR
jgi:hypothetical protein